MLPPLNHANLQMGLGALLGTIRYTTLGEYGEGWFATPGSPSPSPASSDEIRAIGERIQERNRRRRPYEFLVPSGIPQSINI